MHFKREENDLEEVSSDRIVDISHRKPIKRYYLARHTHQGGFNLDKIIANKDSSDRGHESLLRNDDDFFDSMYPNSSNAHQEVKELLVAVIPCYTKEDELNITLQSLQEQTVVPDWIMIVLNGPEPNNGNTSIAEKQAREFEKKYSNIQIVKLEEKGKVTALNFSFKYLFEQIFKYNNNGIRLRIPHVLYMDADVRCDPNMIQNLHTELEDSPNAAGIMARYSFEFAENKKYTASERSFLYGQRAEFAMKTTIQQVRRQTEILGGQGTLFRFSALVDAAKQSFGRLPWNPDSKVEDAELTKVLQGLGYQTITSSKARAWVGPMLNSHSWNKQRQKWQDGHLEDLSKGVKPYRDRYRLMEQFYLGWNLLLRVIFIAVLLTGLSMEKIVLNKSMLIWLAPIILSSLLGFSVARKIPGAGTWEVIRSLLYIPGEIYYLRTLSVWLNSMIVLFFGFSRDGWGNQDAAESSQRKTNILSWIILLFCMLIVSTSLFALSYLNVAWFNSVYDVLMTILALMTVLSCVHLYHRGVSIFRARRRVNP